MFDAQSRFSTFGWWVAWIYLLSLTGLFFLPPIPPPLKLPSVQFVERGITVTEQDGTVMEEVTATVRLSEPAGQPLNVTIDFIDGTAVHGRDFEALSAARSVAFGPADQEKVVSFGRRGRDVEIVGPTTRVTKGVPVQADSRSFIARLKDNPALQEVGDTGRLVVTILRAERMEESQPRATFAQVPPDVTERGLPALPIAVTLDKPLPPPEPGGKAPEMKFTLFRKDGEQREAIATFRRELPAGAERIDLTIGDEFPAAALREHRVLDDAFPEADESYELEMMSSDVYPEAPLALTARNDDGDLEVRAVAADGGEAFAVVDNGPDWEEAARRWWELWGTLPDGSRERLGTTCSGGPPARLPEDVLKRCRGRRIAVECRPCAPPTDVAATGGPGSGTGAGTGTGSGKGGCCRGGGCPGGQGGGGGKCLVGPAVPGDFLLIVVNNERLHEPGDTIVGKVKEALADKTAKPYGNGAIIVNPKDEDSMTAEGGGPNMEKMFQPFEREGEDVAAQQKRVEEVIARKREAAKRPDLRAVVVWPERDLASGEGLKPVAGADQQPVSFLFPGADQSYARNMRPLVPPKSRPGAVTIRSPKEEELADHLINVMRESGATPSGEGEGPGTDGETRPPRDVEEALERSTG